MLARLEHSNLFVARLEHGALFRVHPLFAEFARFQLAAPRPGMADDIHRRAATGCGLAAWPVEAVEHAAAAGDHALRRRRSSPSIIRTSSARGRAHPPALGPHVAGRAALRAPGARAAAARDRAMSGEARSRERRFLEPAVARQARRLHAPHAARRRGGRRRCARSPSTAASHRAVLEGRRAVEIALARDEELVAASRATRTRSTSPATWTRRGRPRAGRSSIPRRSAVRRARRSRGPRSRSSRWSAANSRSAVRTPRRRAR